MSNCLSWNASGGIDGVLASSLSEPKVKSSQILPGGNIAEKRKFTTSSFNIGAEDSLNSTPEPPNAPATSAVSTTKNDFVLHPLGHGGSGGGVGVGASSTGSASSRFNVDLRRSSVSSTGAIQSPTTFIGSNGAVGGAVGGAGHSYHQQIRRKPQLLSSSILSAEKSAFDEKSKSPKLTNMFVGDSNFLYFF